MRQAGKTNTAVHSLTDCGRACLMPSCILGTGEARCTSLSSLSLQAVGTAAVSMLSWTQGVFLKSTSVILLSERRRCIPAPCRHKWFGSWMLNLLLFHPFCPWGYVVHLDVSLHALPELKLTLFPLFFMLAMGLFAGEQHKWGVTWSDLETLWSPKLQNVPLLPTHKAAPSSWSFLLGDPIAWSWA